MLILCDGQRSDADIVAMLGPGAAPAVTRLLATGYLQLPGAASPPAVPGDARARAPLAAQATTRPPATPPAHHAEAPGGAPDGGPAASPTGTPATTRRSLVAARMYLLDMLALQRGVDTHGPATALREARSDAATLDALVAALSLLHRVASPSYCERVDLRLREVLPVDQLDAWAARSHGVPPPAAACGPVAAAQLQPSL